MYKDLPLLCHVLSDLAIPVDCVGVRGRLYEADRLARIHPGGSFWIHAAAGTDATCLFETHHLNIAAAEKFLSQLTSVGEYTQIVKYDFGTYAKVREKMYRRFPTRASRRAPFDPVFYVTLFLALAAHVWTISTSPLTVNWAVGCICAAYLNTVMGGYGHNALHQMTPWAVLLDWNGLSAYEWVFEHIVSHHMHTNTLQDHDALSMEPFVGWLPGRRGFLGWYGRHLIYAVAELVVAALGNLGHRGRWQRLRDSRVPLWMRLGPFLFLLRVITYWGNFITLFVTLALAGYQFSALAHLNHTFGGDARPDFLAHQLANTTNLVNLGALIMFLDRQRFHHLFPSVDHRCAVRPK
jgi:hypothetical protein